MSINPEPEDACPDQFEWPSIEEFAAWLKADPANLASWLQIIKQSLENDRGQLPPEMRAAAEQALAAHHSQGCVKIVQDKLAKIQAIMRCPPGSMLAEDRLGQVKTHVDEITDLLLEVNEPHRTNLLKNVLPIREWLHTYRLPE